MENLIGSAPKQPAGVGGVRGAGRPGNPFALIEDRLDDHHVVGVRAGYIRIVKEDLIAVEKAWRLTEPLHEHPDGIGGGGGKAQVAGAGQHHGALRVVKGTHTLPALGDDGRGGHPLKGHAPLLADGPQPVQKHLVSYRIDLLILFLFSHELNQPSLNETPVPRLPEI